MVPLPRHIASLDVLRVVAALAVVAYHYLYRGAVDDMTRVTVETGSLFGLGVQHLYLGVHLFFVISGFVIMASVANRDALGFGAARFVRLWPTYALCMSITALLLWLAADPRYPMGAQTWAANLSFVAPLFGEPFADGVYWSIVAELVFYGWVTVMMLLGILPRHLLAFASGWLLLAGANELLIGSEPLRAVALTRFAPWFLFGVLLHHLLLRGTSPWAGLLVVGTVALSMHNAAVEQVEVAIKYRGTVDVPAIVALNAGLLLTFLFALQLRTTLPAWRWLAIAGGLTYPLYLLHQNLGYLALERLAPALGAWGAIALTTAGMIAAALLVTLVFDPPARRAVGRLADAVLGLLPRAIARA